MTLPAQAPALTSARRRPTQIRGPPAEHMSLKTFRTLHVEKALKSNEPPEAKLFDICHVTCYHLIMLSVNVLEILDRLHATLHAI